MQKHQISWYILQPGSEVAWPDFVFGESSLSLRRLPVFHFSHNGHDSENARKQNLIIKGMRMTFSANIDAFAYGASKFGNNSGKLRTAQVWRPFSLYFTMA
jgi:hypothetical protein